MILFTFCGSLCLRLRSGLFCQCPFILPLLFFLLALITTVSERSHIHAKKRWRVVTNLFTFPIFMMTYIPITVAALFKKVEWIPTKHDIAVDVKDVVGEG